MERPAVSMTLAFVELGDKAIREGVVVLLHGFLGTKEMLTDPFRDSTGCFGRLIAIDLPYHGGSSSITAENVADAASLVYSTTTHCGVTSCCLVGYSLGGRVGLALAKQYGSKFVMALVLISSNPGIGQNDDIRARRGEIDRQSAVEIQSNFGTFLRRWYSAALWGSSLPDSAKDCWIKRVQQTNSASQMARAVEAYSISQMTDFWAYLLGSDAPATVMICGEEDTKYVEVAERLRGKHSVTIVPHCGHNVLLQRPDLVVSATQSFFDVPIATCRALLTSLTIESYDIPLRRSMNVAGKAVVRNRVGLVVRLESNGCKGDGEISPLPGFFRESIDEARKELEQLQRRVNHEAPTSVWACLRAAVLPSVRFGLEMAACELLAALSGRQLTCVMSSLIDDGAGGGKQLQESVSINAVVPRTDQAAALAKSLLALGYTAIKFKVGSGSVDEDVAAVNELCMTVKKFGGSVRLDANRAWSLEDAVRFAKGLDDLQCIEYIEEPVQDPALLKSFFRDTQLPFALDESLEDGSHWQNITCDDGLKAYVIKPSVLGGIAASMKLIRAGDQNASVVVSSAFESGLALSYLTLFAAMLPQRTAHGLGTCEILGSDLIKPTFASLVQAGSIHVASLANTQNLLFSQPREILSFTASTHLE